MDAIAYTHNLKSLHIERETGKFPALSFERPDPVTLPNPQDAYTKHYDVFSQWAADHNYHSEINAIPEYFSYLKKSDYAANTIIIKRQAVLSRLRLYMSNRGLTMEQHFQLERLIKRVNRSPETAPPKMQRAGVDTSRILTRWEYEKCLQCAGSKRQALFLQYLWITGARVSELTGALIKNCDRRGDLVYITIRGKGDKQRTLKIPGTLYDEIRNTFPSEQFLFETAGGKPYQREYVSTQISKITHRAIGRRLSAHSLRHSWATRKIQETGKIKAVSQYLGHSSVSTTMDLYVHETMTDDELLG